VTSFSPNTAHLVDTEHRGWKLQARLIRSMSESTGGWVCYATRPACSQELNIGRWKSSDLALEHGRAYVDRREEGPSHFSQGLKIQKRRN
jgi:hypothetical protein